MIIVISKKLLFIPSEWNGETLHIYALSRYCIGISPKDIVEWKVNALHHEEVSCEQTSVSIKFTLPIILYTFYGFIQKDMKYSLSGNNGETILMILEKKDGSEHIYSETRT